MNDDIKKLNHSLIVLGLLFVVLLFALGLYATRRSSFVTPTAHTSFRPPLINPEVMQSWLPDSSLTYTIDRIDDYLQANNVAAASMTAADNVNPGSGQYNFAITLQPQQQTIDVSITITNYGATSSLGTAVTINGKLQTPRVPGQSQGTLPNALRYTGFSTLVADGVTAIQANELQQAIEQFKPTAMNVAIDTETIGSKVGETNVLTTTYTFSITVEGKEYNAEFRSIGLTKSQLILKDSESGKQLFDSGLLSQGT